MSVPDPAQAAGAARAGGAGGGPADHVPQPAPGSQRPGSLAQQLLASIGKPRAPWSIEAFALLSLFVLMIWAAWELLSQMRHLLWWGVAAAFLYFALAPAVDWLVQRRLPRPVAALAVLLGLSVAVIALAAALTPLAVAELQRAIAAVPASLARAQSVLSVLDLNLDQVANVATLQGLLAQLQAALPSVVGGAISMTSAMVGGLFAGFMVALFTFVLLADQDRVRPAVLSPMRPNTQVIVAAAWDEAVTRTAGYLYPRLLTAGLAGVFIGISLSLLGCPYPVTLAVWYGLVSQFLPMIGRYVAAILPVLVLGLHNPWDALWFLVVLAVWIPLQDYVIVPRLVVRTMALAPAIIAVSIGVEVFGPFGAFLALPAAAVFQSVASAIFTRHEVLETAPSGSR